MAEIVLGPIVDATISLLLTRAVQEIKILWGIKGEILGLVDTLISIQALLRDAEEMQVTSHAVKNWLHKLKDVAYDAEDVVDEFQTRAVAEKLLGEPGTSHQRKSKNFFAWTFCKEAIYRAEVINKIKYIRGQLGLIATECKTLQLRETHGGPRSQISETSTRSSSLVITSDVVGREAEKQELINILLSSSTSESHLSVTPIVGMGGAGKTTLAQLVCSDESVENHFHLQAWVCITAAFDLTRITKETLVSLTDQPCEMTELDSIQRRLKQVLKGKRFLIVMDDVWSEDPHEWEKLRVPFTFGAEGSCIIVTTRSHMVAQIMGTNPPHQVHPLPIDMCWQLFARKAFPDGDPERHPHLIPIGQGIVRKCHGLPLAVTVLAALASLKRDPIEWENILMSRIWSFSSSASKGVLPAMQLSYHLLPAEEKLCFAYCSLFPKGYEFHESEIVLQWVGAGLVQPREDLGMDKEEIGSQIFRNLVARSFFQSLPASPNPVFKMHDLVHDLSELVAEEDFLQFTGGHALHASKKLRHLSWLAPREMGSVNFGAFPMCQRLRTFLVIPKDICGPALHESVFRLKHLRVLDLSWCAIDELPESIGEMRLLRYLNLTRTNVQRLPKAINGLHNLQTLKVVTVKGLPDLPMGIIYLSELRHLEFCASTYFIGMPPGMGKLTHLRTLSGFFVGKEEGCRIGELRGMNELRGEIRIERLNNVSSGEEAREANLKDKKYIKELRLCWEDEEEDEEGGEHKTSKGLEGRKGNHEEVLEGLHPHGNVESLSVMNYEGLSLPNWLQQPMMLPNLTTLVLHGCGGIRLLPPLGLLPFLRQITLRYMKGLQRLGREFLGSRKVAFPSLEAIYVFRVDNLEEWGDVEEGDMPSLRILHLLFCPLLRRLPHPLPVTLRDMRINECSKLEIPLVRLPLLERLELRHCREVVLQSVPHFTSLTSLEIAGFRSLPRGFLRSLTALNELIIDDCGEFAAEALGIEDLRSLNDLQIKSCSKLKSLCPVVLPSILLFLEIRDCRNIDSLPSLRNNTSLQHLRLQALPCLRSLSEVSLPASLLSIKITSCHHLESLPRLGFPQTLDELVIRDSPILYHQCQKKIGEDWIKVSHIPRLILKG